jgi:hypothetical protein
VQNDVGKTSPGVGHIDAEVTYGHEQAPCLQGVSVGIAGAPRGTPPEVKLHWLSRLLSLCCLACLSHASP